ncbi:MAG: ABC transporter permease [Candidatus Limnocylindrales bacterium]
MRQLAKLTWVEIKLFIREPLTMIFSLAFPLLVLFVMGGVFGNTPDPKGKIWGGAGPMDYLVPGFMGLVVASIGFISLPIHLAGYRERGVLRRFRASSVSPWALLASQLCVGALIAILGSVAIVVLGMGVDGAHGPVSAVGVLFAFVLCTMSFVAIGILLGAVLPNAQAAQAVGLVLFFVSEMTSGVGPPREVMPETMQQVAKALPLTHVAVALQDPWIGRGSNIVELGIVAAIAVVAAGLAYRTFRWE